MRRLTLTLLLLFAAAMPAEGSMNAPLRLPPPPPGDPLGDEPRSHPGRVLVRMRRGGDPGDAARVAGGRLGERVGRTGYWVIDVARTERRAALLALRHDRRVASAVPDLQRRSLLEPSDPYLAKSGAQQPLRALRLPEAWAIRRSAGTVAIVDSGVDLDHPDLAARLLPGRDYVGGDVVADDDALRGGHGTLVAGVAAAATDNGRGIAGVAWDARILPVKVLDRFGVGYDSDIAAGITWAADAGADVINLSLGGPGDSPVLREAVAYATAHGSLVVAAAGNDASRTTTYPAAIPEVVAVAAGTRSGEPAWFSGSGPWIDLSAPGVDVLATAPGADGREAYAFASGTSLAAPQVSGVALLVAAEHPDWTPAQVAGRLAATAQDLGPPGDDAWHGAGRVDAAAALGAPRAPPPAPARGDELEPDGAAELAKDLAVGEGRTARLAPEGDVDWVGVPVTTPGWLLVKVTEPEFAAGIPLGLDARIEAYDPDLRKVAETDKGGPGDEEMLWLYADRPGRHLVRVSNRLGTPVGYRVEVHRAEPLSRDAAFATARYETVSPPESVVVADVTGDGRGDVLSTAGSDEGHDADSRLWVWAQDGDGWLREPAFAPAHGQAMAVATGDVDGDGRADAVVTLGGIGLDVHRQRAAGGLADPELVPLPEALHTAVADLDRDGRDDIVVTLAGGGVRALMSRATGFQARSVSATGSGEVEVGDLDGDGRPDVAAGLTVFRQRADGSFAPGTVARAAGRSDGGIEVADVTGDGRDDLIVVGGGNGDGTVSVLAQDAAGELQPAEGYRAFDIPVPVEAADVTGDGRADVVVGHTGWEAVSVHPQRADGRLDVERRYEAPYGNYRPEALAIGDVTGDGAADVVVASDYEGLVVLRNRGAGSHLGSPAWVKGSTPVEGADGVASGVVPELRFARALDAASVTGATVRLVHAAGGAAVAATVAYDATARRVTVRPAAALAAGTYRLEAQGLRAADDAQMPDPYSVRFTVGALARDTTPPDTVIVSAPRGQDLFAEFTIDASEPDARIECRYDDGGYWNACSAHPLVPYLGPGTHTARFRAVDAAGNVDPTPAEHTWSDAVGSPANDRVDAATPITGAEGSATGTNSGAGKDTSFELDPGGNAGGASVWWRWTAPASGPVRFDTRGSEIDTLLGVHRWTGSYDDPLVLVAGNDDAPGTTASEVTFTATAGTQYWIAVDGFNDGWRFQTERGAIQLNWGRTAAVRPRVITGAPTDEALGAVTLHGSLTTNGAATRWRFEYGPTTAYGSTTPLTAAGGGVGAQPVSARLTGLANDREYHYRLVAVTDAGATVAGEDRVARTPKRPRAAQTRAATGITGGSAVLNGALTVVDPGDLGWAYLEYGPTTAYGSQVDAGFPLADGSVSVRIRALAARTTYHYRLVSANAYATSSGADVTFTTGAAAAPVVTPAPADGIGFDSARLGALLDPSGAPASYHFEYGTSTSYGRSTPVRSGGLGAVDGPARVEEPVTGLAPGTTYHYRLVADNAAGRTVGADWTLQTGLPPVEVRTGTVSVIGARTARVSGEVVPHGGGADIAFQYRVRYGDPAFGWNQTATQPVSGSGTVPVSAELTGLDPATEYDVRIVSGRFEPEATGATVAFTTAAAPPSTREWESRDVDARAALVAFELNPNGRAATWRVEYGPTTAYGRTTPATVTGGGTVWRELQATLDGLEPGTTYHWRVVATNATGTEASPDQTIVSFGDELPWASTNWPTWVSHEAARVTGSVSANGPGATWWFEYGTTTAYGSRTAAQDLPPFSQTGAAVVLGGLTPRTTYHYRVVVSSPGGRADGGDLTFTTNEPPPTATTLGATNLARGAATLTGEVNPNGTATRWRFEYGTSTRYGELTPWTDAGAGTTPRAVARRLTTLIPGATVHYRLVAETWQTAFGADRTVTIPTGEDPTPTPTPTATSSPTPTPTPTTTPTATASPTATPTATVLPEPTAESSPPSGTAPPLDLAPSPVLEPLAAPAASIGMTRVPQSRLVRRGLPVRLACAQPCSLVLRLTGAGRELRRRQVTLAAGAERNVHVRPSRAGRRVLARRRPRSVVLTVRTAGPPVEQVLRRRVHVRP